MNKEVKPHRYVPSIMHMGDCAICGHIQEASIHTKEERLKDLTEQVYAILSEEPTMDVAARQLADIYLNLMQRLLFKFGLPR